MLKYVQIIMIAAIAFWCTSCSNISIGGGVSTGSGGDVDVGVGVGIQL